MNLAHPLKHLSHTGTKLAVSTSFLAVAQTGCLASEDDLTELEPDGGDGALVERLLLPPGDASARYTSPPGRDVALVIEAELEDAPRSPPSTRASSRRRGPVGPARGSSVGRPPPLAPVVEYDPVAASYLRPYGSPGLSARR